MIGTSTEHVRMQATPGGELEVFTGGSGSTLLLLHGSYGWWGWEPVHERLAERFSVLAPSHPGFGHSARHAGIDSIDDLAYFYLDYVDREGLTPARIIGMGMGGWLAAEMAVRCPHALERLVLVDSVGIKISDRETRDIGDPFVLVGADLQAMLWHDSTNHQAPMPGASMPAEDLEVVLRNQESAMYYGWKPYMHNPKLRQRLHRIACPTLLVWGEEDRVVAPSYGRAFGASIPNAEFIAIPGAGHYPFREQVDAFVASVADFLS
jgi:pimeloyl-ACP methyl ester carboxylesterase